jgi:hypothetical protein
MIYARNLMVVSAKTSRKSFFVAASFLVLAGVLVCAGWSAFWHASPVSAPMPTAVSRSEMTLPSQFCAFSPGSNTNIEAKVKDQERTLSDYLPASADSRRRLEEISRKYSLSPEEQQRSDDFYHRTAKSIEPARKNGYLPQDPN